MKRASSQICVWVGVQADREITVLYRVVVSESNLEMRSGPVVVAKERVESGERE